MYPTSARELVRFTPEAVKSAANPPVYLIAPPTLLERQMFLRDMAALGASYAPAPQLFALQRQAIKALIEPADQLEWLEFVDQYEALPDQRGACRTAWPFWKVSCAGAIRPMPRRWPTVAFTCR